MSLTSRNIKNQINVNAFYLYYFLATVSDKCDAAYQVAKCMYAAEPDVSFDWCFWFSIIAYIFLLFSALYPSMRFSHLDFEVILNKLHL